MLDLKALSPDTASRHPHSIKDNSSGPGEGEQWEKFRKKMSRFLALLGILIHFKKYLEKLRPTPKTYRK